MGGDGHEEHQDAASRIANGSRDLGGGKEWRSRPQRGLQLFPPGFKRTGDETAIRSMAE